MTSAERGILGSRAVSRCVAYDGRAFAPAPGTYAGVDAAKLNYTTEADSGRHPRSGRALGNLYPLVAAAMYEAAFAAEFGPLSTWSN